MNASGSGTPSPMVFDSVVAAETEALYTTPDIVATRVAVFQAVSPRGGDSILDLGCGPGFLLRDFAKAVGPTGRVVGIDSSDPMLALAATRCAGLDNVRLERADALQLPLDDGAFDAASVVQVYAYVGELDRALAELRRVLKPGGHAVLLDTDFSGVVWESGNRDRMRKVLAAYDRHVAWPDLPRVLPRQLAKAGFRLMRCLAVPIVTANYHPNTYVHGLARIIRRFVTARAGIAADEADAWLGEMDALERDSAFFFGLNRFLFVARRL